MADSLTLLCFNSVFGFKFFFHFRPVVYLLFSFVLICFTLLSTSICPLCEVLCKCRLLCWFKEFVWKWKAQIPLGSTWHELSCCVLSSRDLMCRACSNMEDEEAVVITCLSLVFCALVLRAWNINKQKPQCGYETIWQRQSLTRSTCLSTWQGLCPTNLPGPKCIS